MSVCTFGKKTKAFFLWCHPYQVRETPEEVKLTINRAVARPREKEKFVQQAVSKHKLLILPPLSSNSHPHLRLYQLCISKKPLKISTQQDWVYQIIVFFRLNCISARPWANHCLRPPKTAYLRGLEHSPNDETPACCFLSHAYTTYPTKNTLKICYKVQLNH